jgi:hypothetical protein
MVGKKGKKQLLVQCLTALHGTMVALLLYYKKFVESLKSKGFKLNHYDPCVANKQVNGEQLTVCFHVEDSKILHLTPKVVDKTIEWLRLEYKNVFEDGTRQMKDHHSKIHKYLDLSLDFSHPNQCRVTMIDYVDEIVVAYNKALKDLSDGFNAITKRKNVARTSAAPDDLFIVNKDAEKLSEEGTMAFHTLVGKRLHVSARVLDRMSVQLLHFQLLGLELQMSMTGGS